MPSNPSVPSRTVPRRSFLYLPPLVAAATVVATTQAASAHTAQPQAMQQSVAVVECAADLVGR